MSAVAAVHGVNWDQKFEARDSFVEEVKSDHPSRHLYHYYYRDKDLCRCIYLTTLFDQKPELKELQADLEKNRDFFNQLKLPYFDSAMNYAGISFSVGLMPLFTEKFFSDSNGYYLRCFYRDFARFSPEFRKQIQFFLEGMIRDGKQLQVDRLFSNSPPWKLNEVQFGTCCSDEEGEKDSLDLFLMRFVDLRNSAITGHYLEHAIRMNRADLVKRCAPELLPTHKWYLNFAFNTCKLNVIDHCIEQGVLLMPDYIEKLTIGHIIRYLKGDLQDKPDSSATPQESERILRLIPKLIAIGVDRNPPLNKFFSAKKTPLTELAYFDMGLNSHVLHQIVDVQLKAGADVSPAMFIDMKIQIKGGNKKYIPLLLERGMLTDADVARLTYRSEKRDAMVLAQEADQHNEYLNEQLNLHHLNPQLIPISQIRKIRQLKKEIKRSEDPEAR